jgi:hypothetical protein
MAGVTLIARTATRMPSSERTVITQVSRRLVGIRRAVGCESKDLCDRGINLVGRYVFKASRIRLLAEWWLRGGGSTRET